MSEHLNYLIETMQGYSSAAAEEAKNVKVGAGRLFKLQVVNTNAAARFLFVFDSAAADSGNLLCPPIPLGTAAAPTPADLNWTYGKKFALGCRIHASTTQATFTASAGSDLLLSASFL